MWSESEIVQSILHERFYLVQHLCKIKWSGNERINAWKRLKAWQGMCQGEDDDPAARSRREGCLDLVYLLTESCFAGLRAIKEDESGRAVPRQYLPSFLQCCTP